MDKEIKIKAIKYYVNKYYDNHLRNVNLCIPSLPGMHVTATTSIQHPTCIQIYDHGWVLFDLLPLREASVDLILEQVLKALDLYTDFNIETFQLQQKLIET